MAELLTKDPTADDIAAAVFQHLVNDPSGGLSAKVKAQVEELLGPLPHAGGAERNTIHEQVEAIVKAKVDEMGIEESLAEMREALSTKQPERVEQAKSLDELLQHGDRHNPNAVGAELDGRFEGFNGFIRAVATQNKRFAEQRDPRLTMIGETPIVKAALTGEEIELGGALVPEEFRTQLMMAQLEPTSIRPRATVLPMSSHTISVPAIRDESHSGGTVFGGVHFQWTESGDDIDDSEPDFSQIRLTAKLLTGRTDVNNTMLADSFASVPMLLGRMWPAAHRWTEELAYMRGTGSGQPLGIKNANCLIDSGDALSGDVDPAALATMLSHLLPESYGTACWHAHPSLLPDFVQLRIGDTPVFAIDQTRPIPMTLFGMPLVLTEHCDGNGTSGDLFLSDWRFYIIGDRQAMTMAASEHAQFARNRTVFRSVSRLDGQPWMDTAITLRDGSHTVSPFVVR